MEIIRTIEGWIYPAVTLFLLIYTLVRIRNRGAIYIAMAFGVELLNQLSWRVLDVISRYFRDDSDFHSHFDISNYYEILQHFSVFLFLISTTFLIIGITIMNDSKEKTLPDIR